MKTRQYWCNKRFYDINKFPYGFARSGVFTHDESNLLEQNGSLLQALLDEQVFDPREQDLAFVKAVNAGDFEASSLTRVWGKYISHQRRLISIAGGWYQSEKSTQNVSSVELAEVMTQKDNLPVAEWDENPQEDVVILRAS